jgi:hypothetical protein
MQPKPIHKRSAVLLALPLMLSLSGCGDARPEFIKPARERVAQVAAPEIPAGRVPCAFDPARICLDDEQTGTLLSGYADAFDRANAKLRWLEVFLFGE